MTSRFTMFRTLFALVAAALALAGCAASADRIGVASLTANEIGGMTERVYLVTTRKPVADRNELFSGERSSTLHFGEINVSVPNDRQAGAIEFPGRKPDLRKQFAATSIALTDSESDFAARLKQEVASWPVGRRTIFIYVHGYNTSFASGLFRSAQLAHDYDVAGVTMHYSWPSAHNAAMYLYDRDSADFARAGFVRMLRIAAAAEPESIVVIAHSMGGLVSRDYVKNLGGSTKVDSLITMGTPHYGTDLAVLAKFLTFGSCIGITACNQMARGSSFLNSLNAGDDTIGNVRYTAIATKVDEVVFPYSTAFLANDGNISNVAVQDKCWARLPGHLGLILDGAVFDGVNDALKGQTVSMNCWAL